MSNGGGVIIICGTGGSQTGDKVITVYDGDISVAIKIDKDALIAGLEAKGVPHQAASARVAMLSTFIEHSYWGWGEMAERLGIPYERHTPHAQP